MSIEELKKIRDKISALDIELLRLLNERASLSLAVGRLKSKSNDAVFKPFREKEVLARLLSQNKGPLPDDHLKAIYREILSSSRRLQKPQTVVYLGPEGTFSYFAGVEFLGHSADFLPKNNLEDVFKAVAQKKAELGIIPLENSLQGSVGQSLDLFLRFDVYIHAEIFCKISHSLLSREEDLSNVERVYSHPQALQQCSQWLNTRLPGVAIIPEESTARAAKRVVDEAKSAAIGHKRLAQKFDLNVLADGIEDLPDNWTRFLIISAAPPETGSHDKTSLVFTLPDRPGALVHVLQVLARKGINMKKLESRPLRMEKWKYVFFVDVECDLTTDAYKDMLEELQHKCHTLRILGSYPKGEYIDFD
ncbi:prephenate dehydratase [Desulfohalobiaceae bacterium Ax17]|jgi:chorismate mutase/prephenate dehydratase|uniref:prephenate dehydratase n=1 Tax=Desulfovulcanus ferrireducens TaxID=2831190 RepID=UPI00207BB552|nr:prephenate dehydratase [Desulfovulcanus ferrireducens]MBT8762615.1 prephenate dehydratase [Desulfovulcanus ferrireducens]